ncbi:MAG: (d)CMP kinase [Ignavibacteriaceae bacterium]
MSKGLIIAIDGPAGSGKSTSAKLVARKLGYLYIDTGAMYRAVTLLAMKQNILSDKDKIIKLAEESDIRLKFSEGKTNVTINGEDVTEEIRSAEVNANVSDVSKLEGVRKALVQKQQQMKSSDGGIVMEGRDIGTVVFPEADIKIFLTADVEQRALRRAKEFNEKGIVVPIEEMKEAIAKRDFIDSTREISPLTKAPGAVEVDTSKVTIDEQVEIILDNVRKVAKQLGIEFRIKE